MKVDLSPRGMGKTSRMYEWLKEDSKRIMLVFSKAEEKRLMQKHPSVAHQIMAWETYKNRMGSGMDIRELAIDNADMILQQLVRHPLSYISISEEPPF